MSSAQSVPYTPRRTGWRSAASSLEHLEFRWIFASNLAFFFAMNGQFVVRSYLAFKLTDSALALGFVNLAVAVPMLLISPFGGVVADRVEKRRLIMACQLGLVANEAFILVMLVTGLLEFWHLLACVFVMGCIFPFSMPARQAVVANIVGRQHLANAMALSTAAMNTARVVGPVTAGFVIAAVGLRWMYLVAIVLYFIAFATTSRIGKYPADPGAAAKSVVTNLLEGVRYVRDDPPVRVLLLLSLVPIMMMMPFQALLVVFSEEVWNRGSSGLGILQAAAGIGGIIGSMIIAWKGETRRKVRMMMVSLLGFAGMLCLFALSPWFLLALPLVLISDVFANMFMTLNNTAIQVLIPDAVRGRVASLMMMTFGLTPLGTMPVSAAADAWGAPIAVAGASIITILASLVFFAFSKALRTIDDLAEAAIHEVELPETRQAVKVGA